MRLFIALDIPLYSEIIDLQNKIKKITKANVQKELHLTLKFLGEVQEIKIPNIIKKLDNVNFSSFFIHTNYIGFFPNYENIRIVWLGIEKNPDLITLQKKITDSINEFKDNHEFKPHITIARVMHNNGLKNFFNQNIKIEKKIIINSFKLYSSTLTKSGPIYNLIKKFKSETNNL